MRDYDGTVKSRRRNWQYCVSDDCVERLGTNVHGGHLRVACDSHDQIEAVAQESG